MLEYPCETCTRVKEPKNCENKLCQQWQLWFFERWEEINNYYKAHKDEIGGPGDGQ